MTLACPTCAAQYNLDESRIPAAGMQLRCPKCGTTFPVSRGGAVSAALPTGQDIKKVELPAGGAPPAPARTTSAETLPRSGAIPLPAPADAPPVRPTNAAGGPVPLPASGASQPPVPPPLPRRPSPAMPPTAARVPLPAASPTPASAKAADELPAEASQLDADELFGTDPATGPLGSPAPRATPVVEIQQTKSSAELPLASLTDTPEASSAPAIETPLSLDLGADLGVAVPAMAPPPKKASPPGIAPGPPPRAVPSIPAPRPPPSLGRATGDESSAPRGAPASASSGRPTPTLGRGQNKKRFQIRRTSGKVFGPFDEERVIRMLVDGELGGTESVKADDEEWQLISDVAAFATVIPKAAPTPQAAGGPVAAEPNPEPVSTDPAEQAAKLQQVYGERMAAMTIVERIPLKDRIRKVLPALIAGAAVVVVLAVGLSLGLTHLGVFARFLIFGPPHTSAQSPAGMAVTEARKDLRIGTYGTLKAGFVAAEKAHVLDPTSVDAEALMAETAGALATDAPGAAVAELARAKAALVAAVDFGPRDAEVLRAQAALKLSDGAKGEAQARTDLEALLKKQSPPQAETLYLLGVAQAADEKQLDKAKQTLQKAVTSDPKLGKAFLKLAEMARAKGDSAEALAQAQKAVAAEPGQVAAKLLILDLNFRAGQPVPAEDLDALIDEKSGLSKGRRASAMALRAEGEMKAGRNADAEKDLSNALKLNAGNRDAVVAEGRLWLIEHRAADALKLLEPLAPLAAKDLEFAEVLAQTQIEEAHYPEATATLATALTSHPDNATLVMLQGVAAASSGKAEEAEKVLLAALKVDPNLAEAQLALGKLYLGLNKLDKARVAFESAVRIEPKSARVHAGFAQFLMAAGDAEGARRELGTTVSLDPQSAEGHLIFGNVLRKLHQSEQALVELRKAEALDPKLPRIQLIVGELLEARGNYDEASKEFRAAAEADPKNAEPPLSLGRNLREAGDIDGSLEALTHSDNLDTQNSQVHAEMALTLLRKAENSRALLEAKTAVEADPKNPDAQRAEGRVELALGSNPEALAFFEKAIALEPSSAEGQQLRAQALAAMSRIQPAIEAYQKALTLDPARTKVLLEIGQLQVHLKNYAEAVKTYAQAIDSKPSLPQAYYLTARAYDEAGKSKDAAKYYELATKAEPDNPLPYKYLGYYYKGAGQAKKAKEAFEAYLERKPDAEDKDVVAEEIGYLKHP